MMLDKSGFDFLYNVYDYVVNTCYINKEYPFDGYYDVLDNILSLIKPNSKVLDIGFGTGILTKKIYDNNCDVYGIDFSSEMVNICKNKMPNGKFYECDFNNELPSDILKEKYDYIISTYAIHHLTDVKKIEFISLLKTLLNDNGKIIIGDISFLNENELNDCRNKYSGFDKDEIYIVADKFIKDLEKAGIACQYNKISSCAAILTIGEA